jgi:hypothetical protein
MGVVLACARGSLSDEFARAVGGNHEAANHLLELYYGGWAAPNIYYTGAAGVVNFGGARIGGLTGIYKAHDYTCGHHERPPYSPNSVRSAYHVRDLDVYRLLKVCSCCFFLLRTIATCQCVEPRP